MKDYGILRLRKKSIQLRIYSPNPMKKMVLTNQATSQVNGAARVEWLKLKSGFWYYSLILYCLAIRALWYIITKQY
jgi:hypothetical protein